MRINIFHSKIGFGQSSSFKGEQGLSRTSFCKSDLPLASPQGDVFISSKPQEKEENAIIYFATTAAASFLGLLYSGLKTSKIR